MFAYIWVNYVSLMCGIVGYFSPGKIFSKEELIRATNVMSHRGPDDSGFYESDIVSFGHRRLSITDFSKEADQPMHSRCNRYVIIYNGEVYNYHELEHSISGFTNVHGDKYKSNSDTEIILELFAKSGIPAISNFNGMFAIAIFDKLKNEVYLIRDRMGIKPLYYYWDGKNCAFASEIKALMEFRAIPKTICKESIVEFLHLGAIHNHNSIYESIYKVEPGTYIKISNSGKLNSRYWNLESQLTDDVIYTEKKAIVLVRELLSSAIQSQLRSKVDYGVYLSGGVDSSLIASTASLECGKSVKTFSFGWKDTPNELEDSRIIAGILCTSHHEFLCTFADAADLIEIIHSVFDEPFADPSVIPSLLLAKSAKNFCTVALSGEGSDELFMGYGSYIWAERMGRPLVRKIAPLVKYFFDNSKGFRYKRAANFFDSTTFDNQFHSNIFSVDQDYFSLTDLGHILSEDFKSSYSDFVERLPSFNNYSLNRGTRNINFAEKQSLHDLKFYLPNDLLSQADRSGMHYSLETRFPFLDHRLVETALRISPKLKYRNGVSKYILKQILYQYIPEKYFRKPKQGMPAPIAGWLKKELSYIFDEYLSKDKVEKMGLFNGQGVEDLIKSFKCGNDFLAKRIWTLFTLSQWYMNNSTSA